MSEKKNVKYLTLYVIRKSLRKINPKTIKKKRTIVARAA